MLLSSVPMYLICQQSTPKERIQLHIVHLFMAVSIIGINEGIDGSCLVTLQDADGNVPFYWGVDSDGRLVVSDDGEIVKKACGKSSAPFPKGKKTMN